MRLLATLTFFSLFAPGCTRDVGVGPVADQSVVTAAIAAWNQRLGAVRDFAVEGEVSDVSSKQKLRFRYAMQQPTFSAGELLDGSGARTRAFVFDGKVLAIIDDSTKTVIRQEAAEEEQMLLALHEIFSQFVCEGWRPPLIKPQGSTGMRDGDQLVLTVPIVDDKLQSQRLTLNADGSFVKKEILDKNGTVVANTTVLDTFVDAATRLSFPKSWSHSEGGSTQTLTLTKTAVNQGVDADRFSTAVPTGFSMRTQPQPEVRP